MATVVGSSSKSRLLTRQVTKPVLNIQVTGRFGLHF